MPPSSSVLHIINTAEIGGGGEHLLNLTRGLVPQGFSSQAVVGRDGPFSERLRRAGVAVEVVGPLGVAAPLRLASLLRTSPPAVLHLHGSRAGFLGSLAARMAGVRPVVYTAHALAFHRPLPPGLHALAGRAEAVTGRLADRVICLTTGDCEAIIRRGVPRERIAVIPNGIDPDRFAPSDAAAVRDACRRELGLRADDVAITMVARLVPQKDPLSFVRMARSVADQIPEARFLLVGDGPLRPQVEAEVRTQGLDGRLRLTGFRDDIPALLAAADLVVSPSLWEGLPLLALEAMAAGKPLVATDLPGHAEVIAHGETGLLVPAGDPSLLSAAVAELVRSPEGRRAMGERGRERLRARFTLAHMIESTALVYRAALAGAVR
jgi:glycosyltransferase involved in cell wall biosynthesis